MSADAPATAGGVSAGLPVQELLVQQAGQPLQTLLQPSVLEMLLQLQQSAMMQQQLQQLQQQQQQQQQQQEPQQQLQQPQQQHAADQQLQQEGQQHDEPQQQLPQQQQAEEVQQLQLLQQQDGVHQVVNTAGVIGQPTVYPQAAASHEQVVGDEELFKTTLAQLQLAMHTREKQPKVAKQPVNLHLLYTKVTALGGCERVTSSKQWSDVAAQFPRATTNTGASHTLRRLYMAQLWDYEQVYFHGLGGQPLVAAPLANKRSSMEGGSAGGDAAEGGAPPANGPPMLSPSGSGGLTALQRSSSTGKRAGKRCRTAPDVVVTAFPALSPANPLALTAHATTPGEPHASLVGSRGSVVVDARFDAGFFVTVSLGEARFRGMLYYPPPQHTVPVDTPPLGRTISAPASTGAGGKGAAAAAAAEGTGPATTTAATSGTSIWGGSAAAAGQGPRSNRTPFSFYAQDNRTRARALYPDANQAELTKRLAEMWAQATDFDKAPYLALANQDKARYSSELEAHSYKLAAAAAAAQAAQEANAVQAGMQALKDLRANAQAAALAAATNALQLQQLQQAPAQQIQQMQQIQLQLQLLQQGQERQMQQEQEGQPDSQQDTTAHMAVDGNGVP